ncbi:MAG: hypothetical protein J0H74_36345 [Chitinophagaceae bacterium]|nr:hypothetical protein [Chitinophagaceae bacterium]
MSAAKPLVKEFTEILDRLNAHQQKVLLSVAKTFAQKDSDWWDEISQEQQQAIDRSLEEMKAGKLTPHDEVMKKYKKWLKK